MYDNIKIDESKLPKKDILFSNKKKSINKYKKLFINIVVKSALYLEDDLNKSNIYTDLLNSEIDAFLKNSDYKNNSDNKLKKKIIKKNLNKIKNNLVIKLMRNDNFKNQIFDLFSNYLVIYKNMAYGKPNKISSQKIIDVVPVKYKKDLANKNNDLYKYLEAIYLKDKKYKYIDSVNYSIYFNNKETLDVIFYEGIDRVLYSEKLNNYKEYYKEYCKYFVPLEQKSDIFYIYIKTYYYNIYKKLNLKANKDIEIPYLHIDFDKYDNITINANKSITYFKNKVRFNIISVKLTIYNIENNGNYHANLILIDNYKKKIIYIEPHGSYTNNGLIQSKIENTMKQLFSDYNSYTYTSFYHINKTGIQYNLPLCVLYSIFIVIYLILNSDSNLTYDQLLGYLKIKMNFKKKNVKQIHKFNKYFNMFRYLLMKCLMKPNF